MSDSHLNRCVHGGHVVGAEIPLGEHPAEFFFPPLRELGCSNLRCTACGQQVRQVVGRLPASGASPADIFALTSLTGRSDLLKNESKPVVSRFYTCRCVYWAESNERPMVSDNPDPTDRVLPWRCDGHPTAELPLTLDGTTIEAEPDWDAVVRAHIGDLGRRDMGDQSLLTRLYLMLTGSTRQPELARAVSRLLDDPSPELRGRALSFFGLFGNAVGAERVAEVAAAQPALFADQPDPNRSRWTLATRLGDTLGRRLLVRDSSGRSVDATAVALTRKLALEPAPRTMLLNGLVAGDSQWADDNAATIGRAGDDGWKRLLWAHQSTGSERIGAVAKQLAASGVASPDALRGFARASLQAFAGGKVIEALEGA